MRMFNFDFYKGWVYVIYPFIITLLAQFTFEWIGRNFSNGEPVTVGVYWWLFFSVYCIVWLFNALERNKCSCGRWFH